MKRGIIWERKKLKKFQLTDDGYLYFDVGVEELEEMIGMIKGLKGEQEPECFIELRGDYGEYVSVEFVANVPRFETDAELHQRVSRDMVYKIRQQELEGKRIQNVIEELREMGYKVEEPDEVDN